MKISLKWLKDYVALDASVEEITNALTFLGLEVEQVASTGAPRLDKVVVGEVLTRSPHPNADRLSVCTVDIGAAGGVKTIVCGAQNYKAGDRVPVALPGAVLPGNFAIRQSKIRGQLSDGMMCSAKELGAGGDAAGLLILDGRPVLGAPINDVLPAGDTVFDLEVTPNRPDCLSHLGVARELAAWFRLPLTYPQERFRGEFDPDAPDRPDLLAGVRVEAPEDCPLYAAHVISGVKIGPSPAWMRERLTSAGLRPINNVVDATNYVMLEYGQPLHAFDARSLEGRRIVVRRAADGEKIVTLDEKERRLNHRMLVIADAVKPVVVAGVMGGRNSGVEPDTTDLVLESAIFRRQSVRWTSRQLGLSTDSSYRYERGVDPHAALEAAHRAIDLIVATAGGRVVGPVRRVGGDVPWKREIVLTPAFVRERLGFDLDDGSMRSALEALELNVVREEPAVRGTAWTVAIPSWRDDLDRPIDLVEEILRVHGTHRIPPSPVVVTGLVAEDDPTVRFTRKATEYLVGHDFNECVNVTLRPGSELTTWVSQTAAAELALANPFVADQSHLRPTLIMGLLDNLKLNQARGVPACRLAEVGRVFIERNGNNVECVAAAFVIAEDPARRWRQREPADFYTAKRHALALAALAGIEPGALRPVGAGDHDHNGWQEGHSAAAGELEHGWTARFGLLSLSLAKSLGLAGKVQAGYFAVLPEKLRSPAARRRYRELNLFPAALRDLALIADAATPADQVREAVVEAGRAAAKDFSLEGAEVFDVYTGEGLPPGSKGLAFSLVFRASNRTLTDDEVNRAFQAMQEQIAKTYPIRK